MKTRHRCYKTPQESSVCESVPFYSSCGESRAEQQRHEDGGGQMAAWVCEWSDHILSPTLQTLLKIFHFSVLLRVQNAKPVTQIRIPRALE